MPTFTIQEIDRPASLAVAGGPDFRELYRVNNIVESDVYGGDDLALVAEEELPAWHDPFAPRHAILARVEGRVVGSGIYEYSTEGSASVAWLTVQVLPDKRDQGIGSALLERLEERAIADSRTTVQGFSLARDLEGERLSPPTGFGSVSIADESVRFLLNRGWSLEQVDRGSRLRLPLDATVTAELLAEARERATGEYRLHHYIDHTPERWLHDMAVLHTRMSTDAPAGGLDATEDTWTVERLTHDEAAYSSNPRTQVVTVAEHVPSGRLVGFTSISVPPDSRRPARQDDTIVLPEHRGHRLGVLLKVANARYLEEVAPGHPSIVTFNAEENRPMLSVNEALGFERFTSIGSWKKTL
ncbi:GNAT superfamily N-acetyltransferase [Leifsonia sp. AK011]|uniref:GNAT family N-acetyltransferase n=1 Tax=Leifsonia sp. AK011 TaxID=2723075 RepID=UPI0015CC633E|nr:GNAT family N-acetyltransferase [Leifsonia sp. AK011]NYF11280.1 GNAT superfamily N-acetyltransferase [Leifsonia sp. AK011]